MVDYERKYNQALDYLYSFVDYSLKHISELAKADFNLEDVRQWRLESRNKYNSACRSKSKGRCALCAAGLTAAANGLHITIY
jgi:hypothetical protein